MAADHARDRAQRRAETFSPVVVTPQIGDIQFHDVKGFGHAREALPSSTGSVAPALDQLGEGSRVTASVRSPTGSGRGQARAAAVGGGHRRPRRTASGRVRRPLVETGQVSDSAPRRDRCGDTPLIEGARQEETPAGEAPCWLKPTPTLAESAPDDAPWLRADRARVQDAARRPPTRWRPPASGSASCGVASAAGDRVRWSRCP